MKKQALFFIYSLAGFLGTIAVLTKIWELDNVSAIFNMTTTALLLVSGFLNRNSEFKFYPYCILGAICLTFTSDYFELFTDRFEFSVWVCVFAIIALTLAQHFLWGLRSQWGVLLGCVSLGSLILFSIRYYVPELDVSIYVFTFFNTILLWQSLANTIKKPTKGTKLFFFGVVLLTIHSLVTSILQYIADHKVLDLILMYAYWFSLGIFAYTLSLDNRSVHVVNREA